MGAGWDVGGSAAVSAEREESRGGAGGGAGGEYAHTVSGEGEEAGGGGTGGEDESAEEGRGAGWKTGVVVSVRQSFSCWRVVWSARQVSRIRASES